eukprot:TRINITY_DN21933_c0_g1_i1.p1 TRINITY_DN21933_c0_g1~~TRINITY_DN21933_c0_g1_i1.p1  ORF type:complete len:339 (+),score=40.40 TRINITY_DN21933_c0_g1_i1:86-1102(+)
MARRQLLCGGTPRDRFFALFGLILFVGGVVALVYSGRLLANYVIFYWDSGTPCTLYHGVIALSTEQPGRFVPSWQAAVETKPGEFHAWPVEYQPHFHGSREETLELLRQQPREAYCLFDLDFGGNLTRLYLHRPAPFFAFGCLLLYTVGASSVGLGWVAALPKDPSQGLLMRTSAIVLGVALALVPYSVRVFGGLVTSAIAIAQHSALEDPVAKQECTSARRYADGQLAATLAVIVWYIGVAGLVKKNGFPFLKRVRVPLIALAVLVYGFDFAWVVFGAVTYPWGDRCSAQTPAQHMWRMCVWSQFYSCITPSLFAIPIIVAIWWSFLSSIHRTCKRY